MTDAKLKYSASIDDAKMILKRLRKIAKPVGYTTAIYGSTVLNGHGHDIDVNMLGTEDQRLTPAELAFEVLIWHAKTIQKYEQVELGDMQDVMMIFVTHDKFYVDLHIKGGV